MRQLREHRLIRLSLGLAVAILASSLAAASDNRTSENRTEYRAAGELPSRASSEPTGASSEPKLLSKFDYLVLASMADSMQPFTMTGYRNSGTADSGSAVNAFEHPTKKRNLQCHL
jgi:hypothetical protein